MKKIALVAVLVFGCTVAVDATPAQAVSTRDWIQLGLNVAQGARTANKVVTGKSLVGSTNPLGIRALNPQPLPPKPLLRRFR